VKTSDINYPDHELLQASRWTDRQTSRR
jgi:hypothetical protein